MPVLRAPETPVLLAHAPNTGVASRHLRGVVRRAVVHHHHLKVWVGLGQHALYGLSQKARLLVAGDDNRYQRRLRAALALITPAPPCVDGADRHPALIVQHSTHPHLQLAHPNQARAGCEACMLGLGDVGEGGSQVRAKVVHREAADHLVVVNQSRQPRQGRNGPAPIRRCGNGGRLFWWPSWVGRCGGPTAGWDPPPPSTLLLLRLKQWSDDDYGHSSCRNAFQALGSVTLCLDRYSSSQFKKNARAVRCCPVFSTTAQHCSGCCRYLVQHSFATNIRSCKVYLAQEGLIFVHLVDTPKGFFESTCTFYRPTSQYEGRGARYTTVSQWAKESQ